MTEQNNPTTTPRFDLGAKVRVSYGVTDPIFPDIPLGGWSGTIKEIEQLEDGTTYEIAWDERTLDGMHPAFPKRCERDGLETETMWLDEEYIEPDDGTPIPMEQPTEIKTPPLSMKDQDDRIRAVFGLTHDDPLPDVSRETLRAYHRHLMANLKFPFTAIYGEEAIGPFSRKRATMTVTGLIEPGHDDLMEEDGLICTVHDRDEEIEFPLGEIDVKKDPNSKLVSDYSYWFHNWPWRDEGPLDQEEFDQEEFDPDDESDVPLPSLWGFTKTAIAFGIAGGMVGATIGAALQTIKGAGPAAMIGGIPLAIIGAWSLGRYGYIFGVVNRINYSLFLGVILGLLGGNLLGVVAGLMMVAFPWSLAGAIAGAFVGPHLKARRRRRSGSILGAVLGILLGTLFAAFRQDQTRATAGANSGLIIGIIVGAGMFIALTASLSLFPSRSMDDDEPEVERSGSGDDSPDADVLPMRPIPRRRR